MFPDIGALDAESIIGRSPIIGIVIALVGGVFLAFGAQLQHRGVNHVENAHGDGVRDGLSARNLLRLLASPSWVLGTVMLCLAILCQLTSLSFAPLIVVQPLGVVGLVVASLVNARVTHQKLPTAAWRSIGMCVLGIAAFVTVAAFVAQEHIVEGEQLVIVLVILAVVLVAVAVLFIFFRARMGAVVYIVAAGVLYGFVATLAKVVINQVGNAIANSTPFDWLTIVCIAALIAAAAIGGYFVQTAYSIGSPDLVLAGLTVVDPLVAVSIGIVVLGEASAAPWWAIPVWIAAGVLAVLGVFQLAKYHPQTQR